MKNRLQAGIAVKKCFSNSVLDRIKKVKDTIMFYSPLSLNEISFTCKTQQGISLKLEGILPLSAE